MKKQILFGLLLGLVCAGPAFADTHYVVKDNAEASSPFTSWMTAASNIQQAIDDAECVASDTVLVSNGVYNTGSQTAASQLANRVAVTKGITVRAVSINWADTVIEGAPDPNTFSNGSAAIRGVYLTNGAVLIGFTITKGYADSNGAVVSGFGGGVFCAGNNSVVSNCLIISNFACRAGGLYGGTWRNCLIADNVARYPSAPEGYGGGGAYCSVVADCVFSNNYGHRAGGGIYSAGDRVTGCLFIYNKGYEPNFCGGGIGYGANTVVSNCVFMYNYAKAHGGGVYRVKSIFNSLIANNRASGVGGGFHAFNADNKAPVNCTIVSNYSSAGIGGISMNVLSCLTNCIVYSNIGYAGASGAVISNNISPNMTSYYCCTLPMPLYGEGNITNDPAFVNFSGKDYHLSPDSPCINKGINQGWMNDAIDLDGRRRIIEGTVDIGAYEFQRLGVIIKIY
ncbi:MAG: choice-of-anchor Q domain-containing protein [Kiritimatiellae bacterium]|nr:choice-of-anchor Q domain-containing protein [Kiritimatiellia bacterium]